jgi:hypothetical protein
MTSRFIQNTFTWTLHELRRLHGVENWEIADRTSMVTSVPYHFVTLIKKALTELKGVIELGDEAIIKEIEKSFIDCLNTFADNMHYLAFENNPMTNETENDYDNLKSQNIRLLIIYNNCITTRTKHIPDLIKQYRALFQLSVPSPDTLKIQIVSLIEQLEQMVMSKYLKSKIILISGRIKEGLLLEGFDMTRSQQYQAGIRDYVVDALIHMVFVHEELYRISPTLVDRVLSLLLEYTYQAFIEWLKFIDDISVHAKLQVGAELLFIEQITDPYQSPNTAKLISSLDERLSFRFLLDPTKPSTVAPELKARYKQSIETKLKTTAILFECFIPEKH